MLYQIWSVIVALFLRASPTGKLVHSVLGGIVEHNQALVDVLNEYYWPTSTTPSCDFKYIYFYFTYSICVVRPKCTSKNKFVVVVSLSPVGWVLPFFSQHNVWARHCSLCFFSLFFLLYFSLFCGFSDCRHCVDYVVRLWCVLFVGESKG